MLIQSRPVGLLKWYSASAVNNFTTKVALDTGIHPFVITWFNFGMCSLIHLKQPVKIVSPVIATAQFSGFLCGNISSRELSLFYTNSLKTLEPVFMMIYYRQFNNKRKLFGIFLCGLGTFLINPTTNLCFVLIPFIVLVMSSFFQTIKAIHTKKLCSDRNVSATKIFVDTSKLSFVMMTPFVFLFLKAITVTGLIMLVLSSVSFYIQNMSAFSVLDDTDNVQFSFYVLLKKIILLVISCKITNITSLLIIVIGIIIYN